MLGGYGLGVPAPRTPSRNNADVERYLRLEYGGRLTVETLLAEAARVSRKAGTKRRNRLAEAVRTFVAALRSITAGHRSKTSTSEV